MNRATTYALAGASALATLPAAAYIGPGAGLSLIGALWAVIAAVGAALFFVLAWPLRRMLRRRRAQRLDDAGAAIDAQPAAGPRSARDHR